MTASLAAASAATFAAAFAPNWADAGGLRALTGLALSGVPAVAMAHLSEEVDRGDVGLAMGLYIAGSTLGGMGGRLFVGAISEHGGWRLAVGVVGVFSLIGAVLFAYALPRQRDSGGGAALPDILPAIRLHLADPGLRYLFALGFLLMGAFVTIYNYIGFRLVAPPFLLSQTAIGFIFTLYLVGTVVSPMAGQLAGRFGRRKVIGFAIALLPLGVLMTLSDSLPLIVIGMALATAGFFAGHSIASSWVGLRAEKARAQASALYLFFYYLGSSVAGSLGGFAFARAGWHGVAGFVGVLAALAFYVALRLSRSPPPAHMAALGAADGVARRGTCHRHPQARRAFGHRRGHDSRARTAPRTGARRPLGAPLGRSPTGEYAGNRLARPARRASGRLLCRTAVSARWAADGERGRAGGRQLPRRSGPLSARARSARERLRDA